MWKTVKLGDVCELATGGTPSRKEKEYFEGGNIKWLVSGDINQREIHDCEGRITEAGLANSNAKYLPENSVLIALNGQGKTRGMVAMLRTKATCNQSLVSMHPKNVAELDTKFLFHVLDGMYGKIRTMTGDSGNDRRGLNMPLLRRIEIPLLPLAEQQRIVEKLDAAFAEIDNTIGLVAKKTKQATLLRQSAIDTYFASIKNEYISLRDAIEIKHGFAFRSEFFEAKGEMVLLTPGNFEETGGYRDRGEKQKYYTGECPEEFVLEGGELLVAMTEQAKGLLGSPIIVPEDGTYLHNQRLGKIQPKQQLSLAWLFHYFNTSSVREGLHRTGTGVKVRHTSPAKIGDLKIGIPSLEEQEKVAETLGNLIAEQEQLVSHYKKKTEELTALKSAILTQELQPPQSKAA